ncbi:hypothetical protein Sru01_61970 [Sphaerisporangium rufum]|uniref:DUF309 domain-containing protein n=1 Tax=Sphaerisporangium rufum TaxID=1381558 RepID=A0A919RC26_9ACTN|nr:DUF309 domain-containing protein [Sphaerisporangium rufum]GII81215.1 hypothetical protein Sru01_61970 [Sphaerisporangium rufum]
MSAPDRDRDETGRPRNARPRDAFGRPLPRGAAGVARVPDDYAPDAARAVADARGHLAAGRPFHAHEVLEARWKTGPAGERDLWQGLAQICVGLTHLQRGNARGAAVLLGRGATTLARYRPPAGDDPAVDPRAAGETARELATAPPPDPAVAITRVLELFPGH